jgi:hypothetical protein
MLKCDERRAGDRERGDHVALKGRILVEATLAVRSHASELDGKRDELAPLRMDARAHGVADVEDGRGEVSGHPSPRSRSVRGKAGLLVVVPQLILSLIEGEGYLLNVSSLQARRPKCVVVDPRAKL